MRKRRLLTDDEIEESVQHDMAILREIWAEQGYDPNTGPADDDDVRDRLKRIEKHLGLNKKMEA